MRSAGNGAPSEKLRAKGANSLTMLCHCPGVWVEGIFWTRPKACQGVAAWVAAGGFTFFCKNQ